MARRVQIELIASSGMQPAVFRPAATSRSDRPAILCFRQKVVQQASAQEAISWPVERPNE